MKCFCHCRDLCASEYEQAKLLVEAWAIVALEVAVLFNKCEISNATDHTEDDMLRSIDNDKKLLNNDDNKFL